MKAHKCEYPNCNALTKYRYCFEHKDTKYIDICTIHGKTVFQNYHCLKCEELKKVQYVVTNVNGQYLDKDNKPINDFLVPYKERLVHKNRTYQRKYIQRLSDGPGIYGIFVRTQRGLGQCLYVGQSVNIQRRVHQHKECFKAAQRHIIGMKLHHKRVKTYKVEYKYYQMAKKYKLSDLKFVKLLSIPKSQMSNEYFREGITYCEQAMIDSYKPKYNTFAARPNQ